MICIRLMSSSLYKELYISDFPKLTFASKNIHKLGLTQPTDIFHHSIESWKYVEENRT